MPSRALAGVKVLDLSRVLAAPLASQCLGDMGAEVIKVERPGKGDECREYGPPFLHRPRRRADRRRRLLPELQPQQASVTVNLASPEGQEIVRRLAADSDIVIENFKTGALSAIRPRLREPEGDQPAPDLLLDHRLRPDRADGAQAGLRRRVPGHERDDERVGPARRGPAAADEGRHLHGRHPDQPLSRSTPYWRRCTTATSADGAGQHIDLAPARLRAGLAVALRHELSRLGRGAAAARQRRLRRHAVADLRLRRPGHLPGGRQRRAVRPLSAASSDRPELAEDPRFSSPPTASENRGPLLAILDDVFRARTADEWLAPARRGRRAGSSASTTCPRPWPIPRSSIAGWSRRSSTRRPARCSILRNPIRFSETPIEGYAPPPAVGEHTDEMLAAHRLRRRPASKRLRAAQRHLNTGRRTRPSATTGKRP